MYDICVAYIHLVYPIARDTDPMIQSRPGHVGIHGAEAPKALRQVPLCHQELPQRGSYGGVAGRAPGRL
jgi:hypothetical protein